MLRFDLVRVLATGRMRDAHFLVVDIEYKVVLAHERPPNEHLRPALNINGNAVAARLLPIQILAGEPVERDLFLVGGFAEQEAQHGEGSEVVVGAVGELGLAVAEAEVAAPLEVHPALAVVLRVERAEPLHMQLDRAERLLVHVRERRSRVDERRRVRRTTVHRVVVDEHAAEAHFEVVVLVQKLDPLDIVGSVSGAWDVSCLVVAPDLEVAAVFAEAHGELALLDDALLVHHVVNGLKAIQVLTGSLRAEPENPVGLLAVKVLGFSVHTAKSVFKHVDSKVEILPEIHRVLRNIPLILAALRVALVEPASVACGALAVDLRAVVKLEIFRFGTRVQTVYVLAAFPRLAKLSAGDRRDRGARVRDQSLRLPVRPKIHHNVIVHKIGRIPVKGRRVQVHMHHFPSVDGQSALGMLFVKLHHGCLLLGPAWLLSQQKPDRNQHKC